MKTIGSIFSSPLLIEDKWAICKTGITLIISGIAIAILLKTAPTITRSNLIKLACVTGALFFYKSRSDNHTQTVEHQSPKEPTPTPGPAVMPVPTVISRPAPTQILPAQKKWWEDAPENVRPFLEEIFKEYEKHSSSTLKSNSTHERVEVTTETLMRVAHEISKLLESNDILAGVLIQADGKEFIVKLAVEHTKQKQTLHLALLGSEKESFIGNGGTCYVFKIFYFNQGAFAAMKSYLSNIERRGKPEELLKKEIENLNNLNDASGNSELYQGRPFFDFHITRRIKSNSNELAIPHKHLDRCLIKNDILNWRGWVGFYYPNGTLKKWLKSNPSQKERILFSSLLISSVQKMIVELNFFNPELAPENVFMSDKNTPIIADWGSILDMKFTNWIRATENIKKTLLFFRICLSTIIFDKSPSEITESDKNKYKNGKELINLLQQIKEFTEKPLQGKNFEAEVRSHLQTWEKQLSGIAAEFEQEKGILIGNEA